MNVDRRAEDGVRGVKAGVAFTALGTALGLAVFAWFVYASGPRRIWHEVLAVGYWSFAVPLPYLAAYFADALGWKYAFRPEADRLATSVLFRLRLAGEALNYLTPTAHVGGEALKAYLARRHGIGGTDAIASVVIAKTLLVTAQVLLLFVGAAGALVLIPRNDPTFPGIGIVVGVAAAFLTLLFWAQTRGIFGAALSALRRVGLRVRALEARAAKLVALDARIVETYRRHPRRMLASLAWHFIAWLLAALEVYLITLWAGAPTGVLEAIAIEAFLSVVKAVFMFAPGAIGFQEGGVGLIFSAFGLPTDAAIAYAVLRRLRELLFVGLGLVFLFVESGLEALRRPGLVDEPESSVGEPEPSAPTTILPPTGAEPDRPVVIPHTEGP